MWSCGRVVVWSCAYVLVCLCACVLVWSRMCVICSTRLHHVNFLHTLTYSHILSHTLTYSHIFQILFQTTLLQEKHMPVLHVFFLILGLASCVLIFGSCVVRLDLGVLRRASCVLEVLPYSNGSSSSVK